MYCCVTWHSRLVAYSSRQFQLNAIKTELQWFGSRTNLHKLSSANLTLSVGDDVIQPVAVVRELLDVYVHADLTMKQHISRVVSSCLFQLRQRRQIRRVVAKKSPSVWSRHSILRGLDYCNAALAGLLESVEACTKCRCSPHHWHQVKR